MRLLAFVCSVFFAAPAAAFTFSFDDAGGQGKLTVTGSAGVDWISGVYCNANSKVEILGRFDGASNAAFASQTPCNQIKKLEVKTGEGADFIDFGTATFANLYSGNLMVVVDAGGGDDMILGSFRGDELNGGDGNDYIQGFGSNDTVHGDGGDDTIVAESGDDTVYGDDGSDTFLVTGSDGKDVFNLYESAGTITYEYGSAKARIQTVETISIDGGKGSDKVTTTSMTNTAVTIIDSGTSGTDEVHLNAACSSVPMDSGAGFSAAGRQPVTYSGIETHTIMNTASLGSTTTQVPATGGNGTIALTAAMTCTWVAQSNQSWVTITNASGSGNGMIAYQVTSNQTSSQRTATITIASMTFQVTQAAGATTPTPNKPNPGATTTSDDDDFEEEVEQTTSTTRPQAKRSGCQSTDAWPMSALVLAALLALRLRRSARFI